MEAPCPSRKSGIHTLRTFHLEFEKAKSLLRHSSDCNKLSLAITGDALLEKFERIMDDLFQSLQHLEVLVPDSLAW